VSVAIPDGDFFDPATHYSLLKAHPLPRNYKIYCIFCRGRNLSAPGYLVIFFNGLDESNPYNILLISGRHKVCPYLYLTNLSLFLFFYYPLYAKRSALLISFLPNLLPTLKPGKLFLPLKKHHSLSCLSLPLNPFWLRKLLKARSRLGQRRLSPFF